MNKLVLTAYIVTVLGFSFGALPIFAQTESPTSEESADVVNDEQPVGEEETAGDVLAVAPLRAEAGKDKIGVVGRNIVFDASGSTGPADIELQYTWDFGDGQQFEGIDASHIYETPGTYKAKLSASDGTTESKDTVLVTVAKDVVLLITDQSTPRDQLKELKRAAQLRNTLLIVVKSKNESDPDYAQARNIAEQLITSEEDLGQAKLIITWTEKNIGLGALTEIGRIFSSAEGDVTTSDISFSQKAIVRVDEKIAGSALARLAQNTYDVLRPKYVLLTTTSALDTILANPSPDTIANDLSSNHIEYQLIGSHSERVLGNITPFNFLSYGINYLINAGVSPDTIFLVLILPIVATIISFGRQIVGVKAFGIYVPSIITLTFVVTQLRYGLLLFIILLLVATISRLAARYLRILYMPRMAIVLTIVSFSIFVTFILAEYFGFSAILSISIFPILVLIILTEKFVDAQIEKGNKAAIILTIETLVLAIISYQIVTWDYFTTFIMAYPEVVLLTLVLNILFGRFTGLRLFEYIRFKPLFKRKTTQ